MNYFSFSLLCRVNQDEKKEVLPTSLGPDFLESYPFWLGDLGPPLKNSTQKRKKPDSFTSKRLFTFKESAIFKETYFSRQKTYFSLIFIFQLILASNVSFLNEKSTLGSIVICRMQILIGKFFHLLKSQYVSGKKYCKLKFLH